MNYPSRYYPKRPIKTFQDLEVYQKTYALAIKIIKAVKKDTGANTDKLLDTVSTLPVLMATAHSVRFGDPVRAVDKLEEAMLNCNLAVVYLEQYRDLENRKIETEFFEEQIKEYLRVRGKIMRLQRSWLKFMEIKKKND